MRILNQDWSAASPRARAVQLRRLPAAGGGRSAPGPTRGEGDVLNRSHGSHGKPRTGDGSATGWRERCSVRVIGVIRGKDLWSVRSVATDFGPRIARKVTDRGSIGHGFEREMFGPCVIGVIRGNRSSEGHGPG